MTFPSRDDGPQGRTWSPAIPVCGAGTMNGRAFQFSVRTEDGETHRFLLTRKGALWLALSFAVALFPRAARVLLPGRFGYYAPWPRSHSHRSDGVTYLFDKEVA